MKGWIAATPRVLAVALLTAAAGAATAQAWPSKPIRFLVPYAPGGIGDLSSRVVMQKVSENLGQQIVIENRPGAGLIMASEVAAKSDPDGYTLVLVGNGNALSVSLFKSLPYDVVNDFTHVSTFGYFDIALIANADSSFGSVADVIAFAKANPGKLNIATINIGSTQNLAAELFKSMAGIDAQTIPFKGTPAVITGLRANDVHVAFEILGPVLSQIKGNAVKALALGSSRRFVGLPGTPTIAESGVPGYQASSWNGASVRAKTPRPIVDRLAKEVAAAIGAPEVKQRLLEMGIDARSSTPEQMRDLMVADIAKWKKVIEAAKIPQQ